jgi:hypothetical protein
VLFGVELVAVVVVADLELNPVDLAGERAVVERAMPTRKWASVRAWLTTVPLRALRPDRSGARRTGIEERGVDSHGGTDRRMEVVATDRRCQSGGVEHRAHRLFQAGEREANPVTLE